MASPRRPACRAQPRQRSRSRRYASTVRGASRAADSGEEALDLRIWDGSGHRPSGAGGRRRAVHLGGRERAVPEQLLDHAQVGAALEQVGGEGVTEPVGVGDEPAERARVETAAARGEEERVLRAAGELRARVAQVAREPERGLLAERDGALLPALAAHVHELLLEVDVGEVEVDRLAAAQAGRVDELDERAVAQCERAVARERLEQAVDLVGLRCVRQAARAARACDRLGHAAGAEREAQERAHGGQPARDRGGREPARPAARPSSAVYSARMRASTSSSARRRSSSQSANGARSKRYARRVASESDGLARKRSIAVRVSTTGTIRGRATRVLLNRALPARPRRRVGGRRRRGDPRPGRLSRRGLCGRARPADGTRVGPGRVALRDTGGRCGRPREAAQDDRERLTHAARAGVGRWPVVRLRPGCALADRARAAARGRVGAPVRPAPAGQRRRPPRAPLLRQRLDLRRLRREEPLSAAVLSVRPDGRDLRVVARGLRNPFGLAVDPATGRLYASVNERDGLGAGEPAETVVEIRQGRRFGWPSLLAELRAQAARWARAAGVTPAARLPGAALVGGRRWPCTAASRSRERYRGNLFVAEWGEYLRAAARAESLEPRGAPPRARRRRSRRSPRGFEHPIAVDGRSARRSARRRLRTRH